MKLFFSNQRFGVKQDTAATSKVKIWLDKQKRGELFSSFQVVDAVLVGHATLVDNRRFLIDYSHKHKGKMYYGNRATITAFRKELQQHGND